MKKPARARLLRLSCVLLVLTLASGCRGVRIRKLEQQVDQLESRVSHLEGQLAAMPRR